MRHKGYFISFEGPEGSGKTTQMKLLGELLRRQRIPIIQTREPGGSKLSTHLRNWILNRLDYLLTSEAELFLFLADRAQHVKEVILPSLGKGKFVLCDRYADSTLAYQGGGRGFPVKILMEMNELATRGLQPDLTVLIDIPVPIGLRRAAGRGRGRDRMENEKIQFHKNIRKAFLKIAHQEPGRFLVLDGTKPVEKVFKDLILGLSRRLPAMWRKRLGYG